MISQGVLDDPLAFIGRFRSIGTISGTIIVFNPPDRACNSCDLPFIVPLLANEHHVHVSLTPTNDFAFLVVFEEHLIDTRLEFCVDHRAVGYLAEMHSAEVMMRRYFLVTEVIFAVEFPNIMFSHFRLAVETIIRCIVETVWLLQK